MPTDKKVKVVETLQQVFSKSNIGIVTDYRGIKTPELNELRRKLRDQKIEYKVVKNSLAQIAGMNTGLKHVEGAFKGPVAIAFGSGDITKTAKAVADYIRAAKSALLIKGGFLEDRILTAKEVDVLAKLPSKEILISRVIGGIQAPIYGIVNVLAAPLRGLAQVLQGRIKQLEAK
jgi:large subunit ribosomal protein L10